MTERELRHEPQVLESEDELPRRPAPAADRYTPEPGPGPGELRAFRGLRLSWLPFAVLLAILVYAALR
jgi:hypothetical protein